jgi:hypothetical protein
MVAMIKRPAAALLIAGVLVLPAVADADQRSSHPKAARPNPTLYGFEPLTPWRQPPLSLPAAKPRSWLGLALAGIRQAGMFRSRGWFCEYLHCTHGPYPLATIWGTVGLFEALDAIALADPSSENLQALNRFALRAERFWDPAVGGYAPYIGDRGSDVTVWFDDNGWLGLAFLNAWRATHNPGYLADAQRAFKFIFENGWDRAGGGMWWNTTHPYHSGPALASDSLLGALLYEEDRESWQIEAVKEWVDWANENDNHDERQLYLEFPNQPQSVIDYVQAPLIYAQYLLCKDGFGQQYCTQAGRVAATMVERHATKEGFRYNFGPQYDAIWLQWMMAYGEATGQTYWLHLAEVNGDAAAAHAKEGGLYLGSWWGGPIRDPETHPLMLRTVGATTSLFAWLALYTSPQARLAIGPVAATAQRGSLPARR